VRETDALRPTACWRERQAREEETLYGAYSVHHRGNEGRLLRARKTAPHAAEEEGEHADGISALHPLCCGRGGNS